MAKMTLQKANAKSKALKKKIDNWYDNSNPMIACYTIANPYIGTIPIDIYEEDIKSQWQSINDLLDQYAKYNYTVMNTLGTVKVKVPKMITITNIDKPTEYEETNIAEAIRRKNLYRELSIVFVGTLINFMRFLINLSLKLLFIWRPNQSLEIPIRNLDIHMKQM